MEIGVITNPNSRRNKARPNRARDLQEIVGQHGEVHATESVDSIKPILREFLRRRARYWVADGGDGAYHWVVKHGLELLEEPEFKDGNYSLPTTVPTNGGTINFVAGNVDIKGKAEDILGALRGSIEQGTTIEEVEVDSMLIDGIEVTEDGDQPFRTYGFGSAVGGVGQRFYSKYYADEDPNTATILKVVGNTLVSIPVAMSPLRTLGILPKQLRTYASDIFKPAKVQVELDGMILPHSEYTGIHIASMSLDLGGVFRFFTRADVPGQMHAIVGATGALGVVRNLPRMHLGKKLRGSKIVDRECRQMTVRVTGDELLEPIIDGEYYRNVRELTFKNGPRVRIPKVTTKTH